MLKKFALVSFVFILLAAPFSVCAEDAPLPPLEVKKIETAEYEKVKIYETPGLSETLSREGSVFLSVTVEFAPPWTEELDSVRVDSDKIKLIAADGTAYEIIGNMEYHGMFEASSNYFNEYRPWQWKEKPKNIIYNAAFAVPPGQGEYTLKLGEQEIKVSATGKTSAFPPAADIVKMEVIGARFVEEVVNIYSVGDIEPKPSGVLVNPHGKLLEVAFRITPNGANGTNPDSFFWYSPWVGLLFDNGLYVSSTGERFMKKITTNVSHNLSRSDGVWSGGEASFFFCVPNNAKSFQLTYLGVPKAVGKLDSQAAEAIKKLFDSN